MSLGPFLLAKLLLKIFSSLKARCGRGRCTSLPGGGTDVADAVGILEHSGDLLKRLASCFREAQEDVEPHCDAEDTEDNVGVPSDVDEGRRDEVAKSEVESPVCRSRKSRGLATNAVGEDLRRVDPGDLSQKSAIVSRTKSHR